MNERTAIVLSGGGARGAYEAGVVAGIVEVLGPTRERAPFGIFTGASVGAINAAWLASHADRPDMHVDGLLRHWRELNLDRHLNFDLVRFLAGEPIARWGARFFGGEPDTWGRSLLNPQALEELVERSVPYERLHENVRAGVVRALAVAALEISTARTTIFAELAPSSTYVPSRDPRRLARPTEIEAQHVLASAALPLLFPSRKIGRHYYCDGGLRFNTPIAPAIRCGAERLVVITLLFPFAAEDARPGSLHAEANRQAYPSPVFLLGKVLNALLLDPVRYDLEVLNRFNILWDALADTLDAEEMRRVVDVLTEVRGAPYRRLDTLVFRPSADIGRMAHAHAGRIRGRRLSNLVITRLADLGVNLESDLLSFILFDRDFADALIELGRRDALHRASEIRDFFAEA